MPDQRIITTTRELNRIGTRLNEAVDEKASRLEGLSDLEKAQFQAQLPRALDALREAEKNPAVMSTPQHQFASLLQSMIAENATSTASLSTGQLEAKFDTTDWFGWAKTLWHMVKDARNRFPWQDPPAHAETIPHFRSTCTLAVFSDWGTGLYGAPKIAEQIEKASGIDIVMHLGDVYYSGTEGEFKDRFSKMWPKRPGALHRALNGNHEMYSGGRPFWSVVQQKPFEQKSTCFAYENDNWVIVGLDTAYQDFDLFQKDGHDEAAWLNSVVNTAVERGKRVVLSRITSPFLSSTNRGPT